VVALGVDGSGDLVAWSGGSRFYPFPDVPVVDPTGAGDAFVAGLVMALRRGADPESAGAAGAAAAASTVQRLGGRPDLRGQ
jgi:ribokinase